MDKRSDIRVEAVQLQLRHERLATPLQLSRGTITDITYAQVQLTVRTRGGQISQGTGAILLSDLWAFPDPTYSHAEKDAAMRTLCEAVAAALRTDGDYSDPLVKGYALESLLPALIREVEAKLPSLAPGSLPYLAALICCAPFDAALHDAWGRALGGAVYRFYTADYLNADLGAYLGAAFVGKYPADFLGQRRLRLGVQHVIGLHDPLTGAAVDENGPPQDLVGWIRRDGVRNFKIKILGQDPANDAQRISAVYNAALAAGIPAAEIHLAIDPNEACPEPAMLLTMIEMMTAENPAALAALDYIEQPFARDLTSYRFTLHELSALKPVIIDESLERMENLALLEAQGWSGLALKTCKGQTHSLLAYCWGKQNGLFLTLQDLTNPGFALVHSANLCAALTLSVPYFEANARQFMPAACWEAQILYPEYFRVAEGDLLMPAREPLGLY